MSTEDAPYLHEPCEIKSTENVLLATGLLESFRAGELVIRDPRGTLALERLNRPVKIYLHSTRLGGQELMGRVYISTNSFMRVKDLRLLTERERRGAFRLAVHLEGTAVRLQELDRVQRLNHLRTMDYEKRLQAARKAAETESRIPTQEELQQVALPKKAEPHCTEIVAVDLSAGGLRFHSRESFHAREELILCLPALQAAWKFPSTVTRNSVQSENAHQLFTGCHFHDLPAEQQDQLFMYLLQEQGRQIQKSKHQ